MKPSGILDAAADVIERNGLHHGDWVLLFGNRSESDCPVCTGGAINLAAIGLAEIDADDETALRGAHREAYLALARRIDPDVADTTEALVETVAGWNDDDLTPDEAVAELRAAAASEREAGR